MTENNSNAPIVEAEILDIDSLEVIANIQLPQVIGLEVAYNQLNAYLDSYKNMVVFKESKRDAKKDRAYLNGKLKRLREWKSAEIKKMQTPINAFKEQVEKLETSLLEAIKHIDVQIEVFKQEDLTILKDLLEKRLVTELKIQDLDPSLATKIGIDDLMVISKSLTETQNLSKFAKDAIVERVSSLKKSMIERQERYTLIGKFCQDNGLIFENLNLYFIDFPKDTFELEFKRNAESWLSIKNASIQQAQTQPQAPQTIEKVEQVAQAVVTKPQEPMREMTQNIPQQYTPNAGSVKMERKRAVVVFEFESNKSDLELATQLRAKLDRAGFKNVASVLVSPSKVIQMA